MFHPRPVTVLSVILFGGALIAAESVTEPTNTQGIPNSSVTVAANGLNTGTSYKIWLQIKIGNDWIDVGTCDSHSGVTNFTDTVDVDDDPGPGTIQVERS